MSGRVAELRVDGPRIAKVAIRVDGPISDPQWLQKESSERFDWVKFRRAIALLASARFRQLPDRLWRCPAKT